MNEYESVIVFHQDEGEEGAKQWVERVRSILEGRGAVDLAVDPWGLRRLAYPIEKETKGIYVVFSYRSEPPAVAELERQLRLSDRILRFLTVREPRKLPPSARNLAAKKSREPEAEPEDAEAVPESV